MKNTAEALKSAGTYISEENWEAVFDWACAHQEERDPEVTAMVVRCYELCAARNMPKASLNLGALYYNGLVVPRNYHKAYALYKVAADAGELRAICNCGYCFYYGRHQQADYAQAFHYFSLGALLHDDANCLYKLGDMYLSGKGVEKNETYAFILYQRALEQAQFEGDGWCLPDCGERVGSCLLRGIGTEKDVEKAHALLSRALSGFYRRRAEDPYVEGVIRKTRAMLDQCEQEMNEQFPTPMSE